MTTWYAIHNSGADLTTNNRALAEDFLAAQAGVARSDLRSEDRSSSLGTELSFEIFAHHPSSGERFDVGSISEIVPDTEVAQ